MHSIVDQHIRHHHQLRPVREIYWSVGINGLGLSLVSIFVPIYLYNLGYSIRTILLLFVVDFVIRIMLQPIAGRYIARYGPKHGFVIAVVATIVTLVLLTMLAGNAQVFWLIPAADAVLNVFHFLAFMTYFARSYEEKKVSSQVSIISQLIVTVTTLGPLIGGIIASLFGLQVSLLLAIVLVSASLIPLSFSSEPFTRQRFSMLDLPWKQMARDAVGSFGRAIDARVAKIVWPFAIFLFVGGYAKVGFITTVSFLAIVIANQVASKLSQRHPRATIWSGSVGTSVMHLGRIGAADSISATAINLVDGVVNTFNMIPFQATLYRHARSNNTVSFVAAFNAMNDLGSLFLFSTLFAATFILPTQAVLILAFVLGAIGILISPAIMTSHYQKAQPR
ncbi:MFS transporter [Patescibacteria group bacterium]|nr:MAG: MFS transporter [Patescibacteria group bacterium]